MKPLLNKIYKHFYTIALISLSIFLGFLVFRGLLNYNNLDFADLGSFPKYPKISLGIYYYDWINQGIGIYGSSLPYALIIYVYSSIFKNPGISEKVWFFSLIAIGIFSMYMLSKYISNNNKFITFIFPVIYIFNPAVFGLIFEGSINDTLTAYVFFPLLIYTMVRTYEITNIYDYKYILGFSLVYVYVYFWNPQVSMWILPILIITFIFYIISRKYNKRQKIGKIILLSIFVAISIAVTGALNDIILLLSGRANQVVVASSTVKDALIDLQENFGAQFAFSYWYLFLIIFILLIVLFKFMPKNKAEIFTILHYSMIAEAFIILIVWSLFHFKINSLTIIIAGKLTELAAYEPFLGVTILFSLVLFDSLIISSSISDIKKLKKIKLLDNKAFKALIVLIIILIFIMPSFHYWRQNDIYSGYDYIENPNYIDNNYKIPNNVNEISTWFYEHTNISQEYRTLFLPDAPMTDEALTSYMPWTAEPSLPNSLWYELLNNQTMAFGNGLSSYGVEYIILYNGPFLNADPISSYHGNARICPSGFPWDLSYNPEGSPNNWKNILKNDTYLTPVANIGNAIIYKNNLYDGILYAYKWNSNYSLSNIQYSTQYNLYLYKNSSNLVSNIWHGYHFGGIKNNWTLEQNGTLVGGPVPKSLSYTNLYQTLNLKNNSYYELNYTISGKYLYNAYIAIKFYNTTGSVIETWIPQTFTGNITQGLYNDIFKTPKNFTSAVIFLTYSKNSSDNNKTLLYFNLDAYNLSTLTPVNVIYNFKNPTQGSICINNSGKFLVFYSMSYNGLWEINNHVSAKSFDNNYFDENYFVLSGERKYSITFEKEPSHIDNIIITWGIFTSIFIIYLVMSLVPIMRKKKNEK